MKAVRNLRELQMIKQKLEFQEMLAEKEITGVTSDFVDNITYKIRDFSFELGSRLVMQLFTGKTKSKKK